MGFECPETWSLAFKRELAKRVLPEHRVMSSSGVAQHSNIGCNSVMIYTS